MREMTRKDLVRVLDMIKDEALRAFDDGDRPRILGQNHLEEIDVPGVGVQRFITGRGAYLIDLSGKGEWPVPSDAEPSLRDLHELLLRIESVLVSGGLREAA